jgi:hypothetical protein
MQYGARRARSGRHTKHIYTIFIPIVIPAGYILRLDRVNWTFHSATRVFVSWVASQVLHMVFIFVSSMKYRAFLDTVSLKHSFSYIA